MRVNPASITQNVVDENEACCQPDGLNKSITLQQLAGYGCEKKGNIYYIDYTDTDARVQQTKTLEKREYNNRNHVRTHRRRLYTVHWMSLI